MRELPCRLPHRVSFILAGLSCLNVWCPAPCGSQSHLDGNSEKTIVSPCVWSEVSKVSSSVDCSERLGDHLQRSAFLKLHEILSDHRKWKLWRYEWQSLWLLFVLCDAGTQRSTNHLSGPLPTWRWGGCCLGADAGSWSTWVSESSHSWAGLHLCRRVGVKQLGLANGDLLVNPWMKTAKNGLCGFWSFAIAAELHVGGFLVRPFDCSYLGLKARKCQWW